MYCLSYIRLHRISSKPRKRPRSCSYAIDISDSESDDPSKSNDTETTEEQADERAAFPPPSKRPRTTALFTCADLISAVQKHRSSWPFKEPVDPKEVGHLSLFYASDCGMFRLLLAIVSL